MCVENRTYPHLPLLWSLSLKIFFSNGQEEGRESVGRNEEQAEGMPEIALFAIYHHTATAPPQYRHCTTIAPPSYRAAQLLDIRQSSPIMNTPLGAAQLRAQRIRALWFHSN